MSLYDRCEIRYVVDKYFLLDKEQSFDSYKKPLQINATGAKIIKLLKKGYDSDKIVDVLYRDYQGSDEEYPEETSVSDKLIIKEDVLIFMEQLTRYLSTR